MESPFRAFVPMECDGKPMHLILYPGQYMKQFAIRTHTYHHRWESIQQFISSVSVILCQSCNGNIQFEFVLNHLSYYLHLALTTIRDSEVGQTLVFLHQTSV